MTKLSVVMRNDREAVRDRLVYTLSGYELLKMPRPVRSSQWERVRERQLVICPFCTACGGKNLLEVHHVLPFHLYPERELELTNLMTLCTDGPGNLNCHLVFGHGGNWERYHQDPRKFSREFLDAFTRTKDK